MSLLVRGGTVVSPAGRRVADVLCEDERIAAVLDPGSEVRADEVIDAAGLLVDGVEGAKECNQGDDTHDDEKRVKHYVSNGSFHGFFLNLS